MIKDNIKTGAPPDKTLYKLLPFKEQIAISLMEDSYFHQDRSHRDVLWGLNFPSIIAPKLLKENINTGYL